MGKKRPALKPAHTSRVNEFVRVFRQAAQRGLVSGATGSSPDSALLLQKLRRLKEIHAVRREMSGRKATIRLTRLGKKLNDEALDRAPTFRSKNRLRANQISELYGVLFHGLQLVRLEKGHAVSGVTQRKMNFFRKVRALIRSGLLDREYKPTSLGELAILRAGRSIFDPTKPVEAWNELTPQKKKAYYLAVVAGLLQEMRITEKRPSVRMPDKEYLEELGRLGKVDEQLLHEMFTSLEARIQSEDLFTGVSADLIRKSGAPPDAVAARVRINEIMAQIAKEMEHRLRTGKSFIE